MTMPSPTAMADKSLGFGLGFGLRTAPSPSDPSVIPGEYFWGGYASTGFTICPKDQTVIIELAQFLPLKPKLAEAFKRGVNAAIEGKESKDVAKNKFPRRGGRGTEFRAQPVVK